MVSPTSRRLLLLAAIGLYWSALFVATHLPAGDPVPDAWRIPHFDKVVHTTAFAGLAVLVCAFAAVTWRPSLLVYVAVLGLLATYGALDELTQGFVLSRDPSGWDWLADVSGATAGVLLFALGWGLWHSCRGTRTEAGANEGNEEGAA